MKTIEIRKAINGYILSYFCKEKDEYVEQIHTSWHSLLSVLNKQEFLGQ